MNPIPKHWSIGAAIAATLLAWVQVSVVVSLADKPPIAMARAPATQATPVARATAPAAPRTSQAQVTAGGKSNGGV